jgi:hypothetical protein
MDGLQEQSVVLTGRWMEFDGESGVREGVTIIISLTPPEDGKELEISAIHE